MRSITVVRDKQGNIKIAQFGSIWEGDNPNSCAGAVKFFKDFVSDKNNIELLIKQMSKIQFFTDSEWADYQKDLYERKKKAQDYWEEFLDADVGVYILSKIDKFNKNTRLISDYKNVGDTMFAPMVFEIDLHKGIASISYLSGNIFSFRVGEAQKSVDSPAAENDPPKRKRGRPKKSEAEKYQKALEKKQAKVKAAKAAKKRKGLR